MQKDCYACTRGEAYDWFCNDLEEPSAGGRPLQRQGRTRHVLRGAAVAGELPDGDLDFKVASRDGFGEDWPLS